MTGRLQADATVRFDDPAEAGGVYGKGFFGTPEAGGGLILDRLTPAQRMILACLDIPLPWPEKPC